MKAQKLHRTGSGRWGFTLVELLVAMALITLLMGVLSQAFVAGLETFRQLKGIGDMSEELRGASLDLRRDVLAAHLATGGFIAEALQTGSPNRADADSLRRRYEAICADAVDLDGRLQDVGRQTTNPIARRLLGRILDALNGLKQTAAIMVELLDLVAPASPVPVD